MRWVRGLLTSVVFIGGAGAPAHARPPSKRLCESALSATGAFDSHKPTIIIVDGTTSTAQTLAPVVRTLGYNAVHLQSNPALADYYRQSFIPSDYSLNLVLDPDHLDRTEQALRNLGPKAIVAGTETGVMWADEFSEKLGLRSNGTEKSVARRYKPVMGEVAAAAGIRVPQQKVVNSLADAEKWCREVYAEWPVILKPPASAGTDKIFIVQNEAELLNAFVEIMGHTNALGIINDGVLLQEYFEGPEYIVETMSVDGEPRVLYILAYDAEPVSDRAFLNHNTRLINPDHPHYAALAEAGLKAARAFVRHGPLHTELKFVTKYNEVGFIEAGSRMAGVRLPQMVQAATGINEALLSVLAFLDPEAFAREWDRPRPKPKAAWQISIRTLFEGRRVGKGIYKYLASLPFVTDVVPHVNEGEIAPLSRDLHTLLADVSVVADSEEQVAYFYEGIRALEKNGFFFEPETRWTRVRQWFARLRKPKAAASLPLH